MHSRSLSLVLVGVLLTMSPALADTFNDSNSIYDLNVEFQIDGSQVDYTMEFKNKLDIKLMFYKVDIEVDCASGKTVTRDFSVAGERTVAGQTSVRFDQAGQSIQECKPTIEWNKVTKRNEEVPDQIVAVRKLGVGFFQQGVSPGQLEWDCGDTKVAVAVIKFPTGTAFKIAANNGRSMVTRPETFNAAEATDLICGASVPDPDIITGGIRNLMGQWRSFCDKLPDYCDKNYDHQNGRVAGSVRG